MARPPLAAELQTRPLRSAVAGTTRGGFEAEVTALPTPPSRASAFNGMLAGWCLLAEWPMCVRNWTEWPRVKQACARIEATRQQHRGDAEDLLDLTGERPQRGALAARRGIC